MAFFILQNCSTKWSCEHAKGIWFSSAIRWAKNSSPQSASTKVRYNIHGKDVFIANKMESNVGGGSNKKSYFTKEMIVVFI